MDIQRPTLTQLARATTVGLTLACLAGVLTGCNDKSADNSAAAPAPVAVSAPVAVAPVTPAPAPVVAAAPEEHHHHHHEHHEEQMSQAGSPPPVPNSSYGPPPPPPQICENCGTVQSVNLVVDQSNDSGVGAVGGALAGGVLGHQMGKGKGKQAMTVLGALGGALAGNAVEKEARKSQHYDVLVRLDNGATQTFKFPTQPALGVGQHVKVEDGQLVAN